MTFKVGRVFPLRQHALERGKYLLLSVPLGLILLGKHAFRIKKLNFTLNKREFRDAIKLRYDWEFNDILSVCVCGDLFDADHALICIRRGYIIQLHNEILRYLKAVCTDVEMEPVLQEVAGEVLPRDP